MVVAVRLFRQQVFVVVEDDAVTLKAICLSIDASPELSLAAAFDSAVPALAWLADAELDVLVTDLGLPDGSGLDVVRAFGERQAAPSIAITGYGMEEDITRCREAGFTDHLTKPVDFKRLERLLAGYLAARDAGTAGAGGR